MIYDQRDAEPAGASTPDERSPWRPPGTPLAGDDTDPSLTDRVLAAANYAAVDRIDGSITTLAVAAWPTVEPATGRLDFGPADERRVITPDLAALQARVDEDRAAAAQLVRPIRVGDVFLVLGLAGPPSRWERLVDLTRAGRLAAKAALFSTVAPAPPADGVADFGLDPDRIAPASAAPAPTPPADEPPRTGPVAYPAV